MHNIISGGGGGGRGRGSRGGGGGGEVASPTLAPGLCILFLSVRLLIHQPCQHSIVILILLLLLHFLIFYYYTNN